MGKQFKSSAFLTRKRRAKGVESSSSSSSDTDGDVDGSPFATAEFSRRERRRERNRDKDESVYCSWSDDDEDCELVVRAFFHLGSLQVVGRRHNAQALFLTVLRTRVVPLQSVPEASPKKTILDAIHAVLTQKWFHGDIETADATYRIQNCPQVRNSPPYTCTSRMALSADTRGMATGYIFGAL
jgi:hypothetical protein